MLFIHGVLLLGGIETFYLRMAKERSLKGLKTTVLLVKPEKFSNPKLLNEMRTYADVYFLNDLFYTIEQLEPNFILILPPKYEKIQKLLKDVNQIHSAGGIFAFISLRLLEIANKRIPITVGIYHSQEYLWGGQSVPYYIKTERDFLFNYLPKESILFFSEGTRDLYMKRLNLNFNKSQTFRLGVIDKQEIELNYISNKKLKIITVGRLVEFKSYNIFMLYIIKDLIIKGYDIEFDVYGTGPLFNTMTEIIRELSLESTVNMHGSLDYNRFNDVVSRADIFIGSGTAIIQAASLGVPSIIGIENIKSAETYGYFSDVYKYEYNILDNQLDLVSVLDLIEDFINMSEDEKLNLKKKHIDSIDDFTNTSCEEALSKLEDIDMPVETYKYNRVLYEVSKFINLVRAKVYKNDPFNKRYESL